MYQGKNEMVAIGLRMGKPIELILATNEDYPSNIIIKYLLKICLALKKISDRSFGSRLSKADEQKVSSKLDSEDMELEDLYHTFLLEVYKYSYDKLMLKHAKWWSVLEEFRTQSLEWAQKMEQEGGEQVSMADLVEPYQAVFRSLIRFRKISTGLQNSLFECCQAERVGLTQMQLLINRWQQTIIYAENILNYSSACEFWATKVATDGELPSHSSDPANEEIGPVLQLRRAIEKLVAFHHHVFTLMKFASLPRMHSTFFSTEIRVTPVEKKRPALLQWPSNKPEWMDLLSTIYIKRGCERESGQMAISCEQNLAERVIEHGRAETVHCECAIVAYLHPHSSSPALSYIGVSKYSCKPSYNWMKAYNDTAGTIFRTKGTNNKWFKGWARPGLGKAEFQEKVDARFLDMVENELCIAQIELGMARRSRFKRVHIAKGKPKDAERDEIDEGGRLGSTVKGRNLVGRDPQADSGVD